jgi:hypothetical protein
VNTRSSPQDAEKKHAWKLISGYNPDPEAAIGMEPVAEES